MGPKSYFSNQISEIFIENMAGGAFAYRGSEGHEIIYANRSLIEFFECIAYEEFIELVGGQFENMVSDNSGHRIQHEIENQIKESGEKFGYVFFYIRTKKGNVRRVVNHWRLIHDDAEGDVFLCNMYRHSLDTAGTELDPITGLYGKARFKKKLVKMAGDPKNDGQEYAIVYLNLVNFKLLNIYRGVGEGDECLKLMAETLSDIYEDGMVTRIADDHFAVFTEYAGVEEKTVMAEQRFRETYDSYFNVTGKFGIYRFPLKKNFDPEEALSHAKLACDHIKHNPKVNIEEYSEELANQVATTEYVVKRLDEAIEKEWVQVYFQPVIRSLTEELCGMEALIRWKDPEIGFLMPFQFIDTLEREQLIHKLDSFVVEKVCKLLHDRVAAKKQIVPVSVNFSRLDFIMCDMLDVVEKAVEKYDIPRDYIHIEITESMIASDEDLMRRVIDSFKEAGYEIWMDDFGSGYSSLTLLKDYQFDMLKMDMSFLHPFSEKSKSLVRSTVSMAKDIGMSTLAEGVETREHLDFLKEIGCEKIQGYYYGKPEPIDEMFAHMEEKGIKVETRRWRKFYETASFNVRYTENPLEVVEYDGENFRTLYMNRKYREQIFRKETPLDLNISEVDRRVYDPNTVLFAKYKDFVAQMMSTGNTEIFYYTVNGYFMCFKGRCIATNYGHALIKASIVNLSMDQRMSELEALDSKLKEINLLFEDVLLLNHRDNSVAPLLGGFRYVDNPDYLYSDYKHNVERASENIIYPTEKKRYLEFLDLDTMKSRIDKSGKGYVESVFRVKQEDGSFKHKDMIIMQIPATNGNEFLFCMRPYMMIGIDDYMFDNRVGNADESVIEFANLWRNAVCNTRIKAFWKDKNRVFRGVSRSFMDYFGIVNENDIIGKTDDEKQWFLDENMLKKDELEVLNTGKPVSDITIRVIAKGSARVVVISMIPVYKNDDIVGTLGYFVDVEEDRKRQEQMDILKMTDPVTGLINIHTFMESMIDLALQYEEKKKDYGLILLKNTRHDRIVESYDEEFANKVLHKMGQVILDTVGDKAVVARTRESIFAVLMPVSNYDDLRAYQDKLKNSLNAITEVEGLAITPRVKGVCHMRSEQGMSDAGIFDITRRELADTENS